MGWLHLGSLGGHLSFATREHPGGLWEQQDGHMGIHNRFLAISGRFRDPILKAFWVPWADIQFFLRACFQDTFRTCIEFCVDILGFKTRVSYAMYFEQQLFAEIVFWRGRGRYLLFFLCFGSSFSDDAFEACLKVDDF